MVPELWLPSVQRRAAPRRGLIYLICGNPGLIAFYADFLEYLRVLLDQKPLLQNAAYDIFGRNLLGFSDEEHAPFDRQNPPYDLEREVQGIYNDIVARAATPVGQEPYDSVILMGHSVGAYIAVEVFHRHMKSRQDSPLLNLSQGFLLFPTLSHLAQSRSGQKLSLLGQFYSLGGNLHVFLRSLLWPFPAGSLRWFIRNVMQFSPRAADVTAEWLKSKNGIWQALYLGQSELQTIREDLWEEELWEVSGDSLEEEKLVPKFFMLYAKRDHWIADRVRDDFIERRREHGERGGRTKIRIDQGEIQHDFCTKQGRSTRLEDSTGRKGN